MTSTTVPDIGTTTGTATALALRGVHKSFGQVRAVRGVDLDVPPGRTVALLGPNGAGKSTTVDLALGLIRPDRGTAAIFGLTPRRAVETGTVGAMLQSGGLPRDVRVRDLLPLVASLHAHPLPWREALDRAGATELAGRRVQQLSGGEVQRVRLALALLPDPSFLVLDEPTAAMDVGSRRAFWARMTDWVGERRALLFTTHHLEEADAFADRIVMLGHGQVIADGSAAEVKALAGLRRITARLPHPPATDLANLPGVVRADLDSTRVRLSCTDSDAALRALLAAEPGARDIEVTGAALEDAFVALTSSATKTATDSTDEEQAR